MQYASLHDLLMASRSSKRFFLSLPVATQMELHKHNQSIHSAQELHRYADVVEKYNRAVEISRMLF